LWWRAIGTQNAAQAQDGFSSKADDGPQTPIVGYVGHNPEPTLDDRDLAAYQPLRIIR
jgi:hypothetical protein